MKDDFRKMSSYKPDSASLLAMLEKINQSTTFSRSKVNSKLLAYLVNHHIKQNDQGFSPLPPKETEIAIDVFERDTSFNPNEDGFVRVYVSNLRKKLDAYYRSEGSGDVFQITIPPGSYSLHVIEGLKPESTFSVAESLELNPTTKTFPDERTYHKNLHGNKNDNVETYQEESRKIASKLATIQRFKYAFIASSLLLLFSITTNIWLFNQKSNQASDPYQPIREHSLWRDLFINNKPTLIVIGDLYFLSEQDPETGINRGIREFNINSDDDLANYLKKYPFKKDKVKKAQSAFILKNSVLSLKHILPLFKNHNQVQIRMVSDLTPDDLREYNLIYLGLYKSLGSLDAYLQGSNFTLGNNASLRHNKSKNVYKLTGNLLEEYTDYGLFSKFSGPSGNVIYTLSGFSDSSIIQISKYLTDPAKLINNEFKQFYQPNNKNFELLFSTSGFNRTDLGSTIISSDNLDVKAIWSLPPN